ncbi:MAG: F0F1 ATP synthase subunit B' [Rhodospirillales bacterium]|nr:F0F1 ATP synthase subunit B' [Rhodospirillales bacterium]
MPQLNLLDFPPQLVWLAITFVILYLVMAKVALPRVAEVLETRAERIRDDLDRATELRNEAMAAQATYEKALAEARAQAQNVMRETSAKLTAAAAARQAELAAELTAKTKAAEATIAAAKAKAIADLQSVAAEAARSATQRLIGVEVSPADAARVAAATLKERG